MKKKELITAVAAKRQLKQKDAAALEDAEKNRSSCYQSAGFPCGQAIKAQRKSLSIRSVYPTKRSVGRSIYGLHQKAIVKAV